jgi:hypothetical protein
MAVAMLVAAVPAGAPVMAAEEGKAPSAAELRRERRKAVREAEQNLRKAKRSGDEKAIAEAQAALKLAKKQASGKGGDMAAEFAALMQAEQLLKAVVDRETAEKAADKILNVFEKLEAPTDVSDDDIERWATEQNKVNREMERLRKEPWFVESGLQEAWTAVTDPFSRKRARRLKR